MLSPFPSIFDDLESVLRPNGRQPLIGPRTDLVETKDKIVLLADLPGIKKEDINVTLDHGRLCISGKMGGLDYPEEHQVLCRERGHGMFTRCFELQRRLRQGDIRASYRDGVLAVEVPKEESASPRSIAID
eukprot:TRINITY_DN57119_c0_g1_i1.p1 TRINITY_DN57119_c0_g1~~TRINITY_DN57119_c0_g1_i1.p1  ORF type:complete len:131 (-),score=25.52 TRINITY_DN57119_c0_g1_i1:44-436(-)